jgi:hypothetical protein
MLIQHGSEGNHCHNITAVFVVKSVDMGFPPQPEWPRASEQVAGEPRRVHDLPADPEIPKYRRNRRALTEPGQDNKVVVALVYREDTTDLSVDRKNLREEPNVDSPGGAVEKVHQPIKERRVRSLKGEDEYAILDHPVAACLPPGVMNLTVRPRQADYVPQLLQAHDSSTPHR